MDAKAAGILGGCIVAAAVLTSLLPTAAGRYRVVRLNDSNCLVIDTRTGRSWQRFVSANQGPTNWTEVTGPWAE